MTRPFWVVMLLLSSPALVPTASATGSLESGPGFHVASFPLPGGTIYVNLPDDLAPGDTASATVNPVPAGADATDQARQREGLNAYGVEIAGQRAPASVGVRTFTVPAGMATIVIRLLDRRATGSRPWARAAGPYGSRALSTATFPTRASRSGASPRSRWPSHRASSWCAVPRSPPRRRRS